MFNTLSMRSPSAKIISLLMLGSISTTTKVIFHLCMFIHNKPSGFNDTSESTFIFTPLVFDSFIHSFIVASTAVVSSRSRLLDHRPIFALVSFFLVCLAVFLLLFSAEYHNALMCFSLCGPLRHLSVCSKPLYSHCRLCNKTITMINQSLHTYWNKNKHLQLRAGSVTYSISKCYNTLLRPGT